MTTLALPAPSLAEGRFASLTVFTDEALFDQTGIRIAFTTRMGGISVHPYESLNVGNHVNDDPFHVEENRQRVVSAFADKDCPLVVPHQVHQDTVVAITSSAPEALEQIQDEVQRGADALILNTTKVAALLCYADCVPVILVGPDCQVAVVHAGWRGVDNGICVKTAKQMAAQALAAPAQSPTTPTQLLAMSVRDESTYLASMNVYLGPYIHEECFETSEELACQFEQKFGASCRFDNRHINLGNALRTQLTREGVALDRIADLDRCTVCNTDLFFSYRAEQDVTGRHGAFAVRTSY